MIKREWLEEILGVACSTGGDFAEVFAEHTRNHQINFVDRTIDRIGDNVLSGVGIRVFLGKRTVFASTSDLTREGLLACARSAADALGEGNAPITIRLSPQGVTDCHPILRSSVNAPIRERIDVLRTACLAAHGTSELISQVQGTLGCVDREILIANTEGLCVEDRHQRTRITVSATASKDGENQSGFFGPG